MLPSLLDQTVPDLPHRATPSYNVGTTYGFFPPVHLVYVHGFRGDHTSFQRFPTDLHYSLEDRIPSLTSHVYPTYKSRKPIQVSAERLMTWLQTLEPGFIVLIGHSLGGFVVTEAALQYRPEQGRSQVIGLIAMDVPYLGVHPHVIVSGIASLLPVSEKPAANEGDLNDSDKINMVNPSDVSSEISVDVHMSSSPSPSPSPTPPRSASPSPSGRSSPNLKDMSAWKLPDLTPGPTLKQNAAHFFRKHSRDPFKAMSNWLVSHWEHGSMLLDPSELCSRYERLESWKGGEWVNFYTETVPEEYKRSKSRSRSRSRSPNPDQPSTQERSGGVTSHEPEKKIVKIHFPEPRPCSPIQTPLSTESEITFGSTEGGLSTFCTPQSDVPTIKFPEPETSTSPSASPRPTKPEPLPVDLGSSPVSRPDEKSERPATEQEPAPPSTSSVLSLITAPIKAAVNPNDSGRSPDSASDTASIHSQPDSLFPLPHPPLNDEQQKKHDKVVNKLVKQQKKEEAQAVKAADKEEKAVAKAESKAEEKKAKEERNVLKKQATADQKEAALAAKEAALAAKEAALAAKEEAEKDKPCTPRHFIITPRDRAASRTRWEKVAVAGSPSEVDAHCGIFFREKNWEYDGFVERVAQWVQELCEKKAKEALAY